MRLPRKGHIRSDTDSCVSTLPLSLVLKPNTACLLSGREWPNIELAQWRECEGSKHLEQFFQDIMDMGGEGVILRDPNAPLQPGRSPGFLKHKVL
jgi:hypothetical protein